MSSKCSVLVADDNHEAADALVDILGAMGHIAVAAYDGGEAVAACAELKPALAILDVQMPLLDGCEAAHLIHAGARPPGMIAALSALRHWDEPMKSKAAFSTSGSRSPFAWISWLNCSTWRLAEQTTTTTRCNRHNGI